MVKFLVSSLFAVIRFTAWGIICVASDYFKSIGENLWVLCLEYILEKGRAQARVLFARPTRAAHYLRF